jgi:hypothetical protein
MHIKVLSTALHNAGWSAFHSGVQLHAQAATATRGKEPGGLALLSKRTANQCINRWPIMHRQGPQHCLAKCWLVSLFLRGSTACPTITASPAGTHLLRLL